MIFELTPRTLPGALGSFAPSKGSVYSGQIYLIELKTTRLLPPFNFAPPALLPRALLVKIRRADHEGEELWWDAYCVAYIAGKWGAEDPREIDGAPLRQRPVNVHELCQVHAIVRAHVEHFCERHVQPAADRAVC